MLRFNEQSALAIYYTDRRDLYIGVDTVKELWKEGSPFLSSILQLAGWESIVEPDYKMFEYRPGWINQSLSINAGSPAAWTDSGAVGATLAGDAYVAVDGLNGLGGAVGDHMLRMVLEIWDSTETTYKGVARITATHSTSGVKLKALGNPRSSTNVMVALADDDKCYVITTMFEEGSYSPDAFHDDLEVVYNSSGIQRTSLELTGTAAKNTKLRGWSNELGRIRVGKSWEHKLQLSRGLLRGVRVGGTGMKSLETGAVLSGDAVNAHHTDATNSTPIRSTMGLISAIYRYGATSGTNRNIFEVAAGTYNYDMFVDDAKQIFRFTPFGGVEKVAFCGANSLAYWSKLGNPSFINRTGFTGMTLEPFVRDQEMGFNFRRLVAPGGTIKLVPEPALDGPYANMMLITDVANLGIKVMEQTKLNLDIKKENAYDGIKDEYYTDLGLMINLIETQQAFVISGA